MHSRTLSRLTPGARIFACIPGTGYVGVGIVKGESTPYNEFMIDTEHGTKPISQVTLKSANMAKGMDDPDRSEYLVAIDWIKALPRDQAYWEKGMYANQNTVTKLRNRFTLERLIEHFGLSENA